MAQKTQGCLCVAQPDITLDEAAERLRVLVMYVEK